jgi:hypothetical protein
MYQIQGINKKAIAVLIASLALAACGGGGDDNNSSSTTTTTSNSSSSAATSSATSSAATSSAASSAATSSAASSAATSSAASSAASSSAASVTSGSFLPTYSSLSSFFGTCTSGNYAVSATGTETAIGAVSLYSASASSLRLYDGTSTCTGTTFAINYNGTSFVADGTSPSNMAQVAVGNTVDVTTGTSLSRYIKIPYSSAATTAPSVSVKFTNSSSTCANSQVIIANAAGKVLNVGSACVSSTQTTLQASDTVAVGAGGAFYVLFLRAGDSSGGIRVWEVDYTY